MTPSPFITGSIQFPTPYWQSQSTALYLGDVREQLSQFPSRSVHAVITSPPYWGQRKYSVGNNGSQQLGMEENADCLGWANGNICGRCFVCHLVEVFNHIHRVLRNDGTVWLNLGDSIDSNQLMIPARVGLALQTSGWILRQDIIWYAPNKMAESITDRCTKSHEHILMLVKQNDYYFDQQAIKTPAINDQAKAQTAKNKFNSACWGS